MPSKSKKQHDFMAAVANNPKFAKQAGVPQSVGKEFIAMDKKMKKYMSGGRAMMDRDAPRSMRKGPSSRPRLGPNRDMERLEGEADEARRRELMLDREREKDAMRSGQGANMKRGGKVKKMAKGGKVRGAGMAKKGVRPCKMM